MPTPPLYTLRLLGRVELRDAEGNVLALPTRKTALLLAMLARSVGERRSREELASAVWEGADPRAARESLRTALSALRKRLPEGAIRTEGDQIVLGASIVHVLPESFEDGDFMPGYDNDWTIDQRLRIRAGFVAQALASARVARLEGDAEAALAHVERACDLDPLDAEAADLRTELLEARGRSSEASARKAAYRSRVARELGIAPEAPRPSRPEASPLLAAVRWTLAREPEEACAMVAATYSQWLAMSLETALEVHREVLASTARPSTERRTLESRAALFEAMIDPASVRTGRLERLYRAALRLGEASITRPLCEALTYGHLSTGNFERASAYVREGEEVARRSGDPAQISTWCLHRGVVEFHAGSQEAYFRHIEESVVQAEASGSALSALNAHNGLIGFLIHRGKLDLVARMLDAERQRVAEYGGERMMVWMGNMEASLYERMGDLHQARAAYRRFRDAAPAAGQCAVAMADDGLMRVSCGLRVYDEAAEALARNVAYRRRKGSVPSAFERNANAPTVRTLRERIGDRVLTAAFERAAAVV